jgi:hypothetical protein
VTQLDVEAIPFKSSWSSWVIEYALMKAHPELYSWMTKITEEFEDRSFNLNEIDQKNAVIVFQRMFQESCDSKTSDVDEKVLLANKNLLNALSAEDNNSISKIVTPSSSSTIVPMKRRTIESIISSNVAMKAIELTGPVSGQSNLGSIPTSSIPLSNNTKNNENIINQTNLASSAEESNDLISMKSRVEDKNIVSKKVKAEFSFISNTTDGLPKRHSKGTRPRGCPCCDPDDIDNIIDKMLSLEAPV